MSDILLHEVKDKTEIITFNNPEKLNVLSDQMLELLTKALEKASRIGQLFAFKHKGFWKCVDTKRDKIILDKIYKKNKFNWKNSN